MMKDLFHKTVGFMSSITWRSDVFSRDGRLVKGFFIVTWHNVKIARISAIIDSNGMVTIVRREGPFYNLLKDKLEYKFLDVLDTSDSKGKYQTSFHINHCDFQYL